MRRSNSGWPQNAATRGWLETPQEDKPDDPVVMLSLAEVMLKYDADRKSAAKAIVGVSAEVKNDTLAHAALLLCKGHALRELDLIRVQAGLDSDWAES